MTYMSAQDRFSHRLFGAITMTFGYWMADIGWLVIGVWLLVAGLSLIDLWRETE